MPALLAKAGHRSTFAGSFEAGYVGTMALVPQVVDAVGVPVIASGGIMDGRGIAACLVLGAGAVQMGTAFLTCDEAGIPDAYKDAILAAGEDAILPFPLQNALTRPLRSAAAKPGRAELLSLWAGQGVRLARRQSAGDLVARLARETDEAAGRIRSR